MKVLLLICQLPLLTRQDDDEKKCPPLTITEAKVQLRLHGGGPLGAYNKNYMAFTLDEVRRNFKNPVTMQPGNFSALFASANLADPCKGTTSGNGCKECFFTTDFGQGHYPRYIEERSCESTVHDCDGTGNTGCRTAVMKQRFLKDPSQELKTCDKKLKLDVYYYDMKMCCQCVKLT